jgi:hypothetical protein
MTFFTTCFGPDQWPSSGDGLFILFCFPCFDVTQCVAPLCMSYASGRDVSDESQRLH